MSDLTLPKNRIDDRQNFPFPLDNATVYETPPTLIWTPLPDSKSFTVTVWDASGREVVSAKTEGSHFYDKVRWAAGEYTWDVSDDLGRKRGVQRFTISPDAVFFDRPTAEEILSRVPSEHPRDLFSREDVPSILKAREKELETLKRTIAIALENPLPEPPKFQHGAGHLPYREYFGRFRDTCDRDLVALALGYALLGDEKAGEKGKKLLLTLCDMNPLGPCSLLGRWGDEIGLSMARCLPAVFDLLYPTLDEKQRRYVAETVAVYAEQCKERLEITDYAKNPKASHAGRIPAYLGEAAIVLRGEGVRSDEALRGWLEYALDIYCGPFPHYGTPDGAWAESAFYATSYTKWYLPFFSAVERFSGKSLFHRPFYMRYSQFALHFCHPDYEIHPFGDGYWCNPEDEEWPGFFAQNPYRVYAERFGPAPARELMQRLASPDIFKLHLLDVFLPKGKDECGNALTGDAGECAVFCDGGYVAMHTDMGAKDDICLLARATPFPYGSHRHADQGSFALFFGGKALISPSGYFGRQYGTKHHYEWTNTTKAHNVPLINGKGQTGKLSSVGKIIDYDLKSRSCTLDLSALYDGISKFTRRFELDKGGLTLTDEIISDEPVSILYPLHSLSEPCVRDGNVSIERGTARLDVKLLTGELTLSEITDEYDVSLNDGEPEEFAVTMPKQYHVYYTEKAKTHHTIKMRFEIGKA